MVESPDLRHGVSVARQRGEGRGAFQVYFPEEIVHAAGMLPFKVQGRSRAQPGRLPLRLLPVLDPQDLPRTGPEQAGRVRSLRVASHLRRSPQSGCDLGAQLRPPLSDPLSAAEPELDGQPPSTSAASTTADAPGGPGWRDARSAMTTCAIRSPCSTRTGPCFASSTRSSGRLLADRRRRRPTPGVTGG